MQGRRALSVIFVCLHMKTPRQQMATPQRSRTERSLPSVPSEIPYASSASYILWRSRCSFIVCGRCQIVSSIASANSTKNSIPVTTSLSITSAIFTERKAHAFVPSLSNAFSDYSAGSSVALSFSWTANRWSNCCTAVA